jgi:SAM-dependent methyltransferase
MDEWAGAFEPVPMVDVFVPMMKAGSILAAARLGLFEALETGPATADELARRIGASSDGTAKLADFLVSIGYLRKTAETFTNAEFVSRWFTSKGQIDYTAGLLWSAEAWTMLPSLADAVRAGGPGKSLWQEMIDRPELGPLFSRYMNAFASDVGPDLFKAAPVSPAHRRVLDLGGSHGLHSIGLLKLHPQLEGTIVDLASALTGTQALIDREGLTGRVGLRPADLRSLDWGPAPVDIVLFCCVAHNMSGAENAAIFKAVHERLAPGGFLLVHDYMADIPGNPYHAAFQLTLLYETGTQIHRWGDYRTWLSEAGFSDIERRDLSPIDRGSVIVAKR